MTKLNNISKFSLVSTVDVEANLQNIVYQPRERYGTFFFVALFAEVEMSAHAEKKKRKKGRTKEGDLLFSPPPLLAGRRFGESQCAASKGIHANAILKRPADSRGIFPRLPRNLALNWTWRLQPSATLLVLGRV